MERRFPPVEYSQNDCDDFSCANRLHQSQCYKSNSHLAESSTRSAPSRQTSSNTPNCQSAFHKPSGTNAANKPQPSRHQTSLSTIFCLEIPARASFRHQNAAKLAARLPSRCSGCSGKSNNCKENAGVQIDNWSQQCVSLSCRLDNDQAFLHKMGRSWRRAHNHLLELSPLRPVQKPNPTRWKFFSGNLDCFQQNQ